MKSANSNPTGLLSCLEDLHDNRYQGEIDLAQLLQTAWPTLAPEHRRDFVGWLADRPSLLKAMNPTIACEIAQALNDSLSFEETDSATAKQAKTIEQLCKSLGFVPVPNRAALHQFVSTIQRGVFQNVRKVQTAWEKLDNGLDPAIRSRVVKATLTPLLATCRDHTDHWSVLLWSSSVATVDCVAEQYTHLLRSEAGVRMTAQASGALALATVASKPESSPLAGLARIADRELDGWLQRLKGKTFQSVGHYVACNANAVPPDQLKLWKARFARIDRERRSLLRRLSRLLGFSRHPA